MKAEVIRRFTAMYDTPFSGVVKNSDLSFWDVRQIKIALDIAGLEMLYVKPVKEGE